MALIVNRLFNIALYPTTLHRYLRRAGIVWRRAAPTLRIKDPYYEEKRLAIEQAVSRKLATHLVFYQDEVDIDLNPKIGADWILKGQQKRITTLGHNQKYYLAGTLRSDTRRRHYIGGSKKCSDLLIVPSISRKCNFR